MSETEPVEAKITTRQALKMAFADRQVLAMLILGLASGLPYVAVGGTLNAWLVDVQTKPVMLALVSWAALAYSFKFLWAAALQGRKTPFGFKIGARRFLMAIFLGLVVLGLFALTYSEPPNNMGRIMTISILIAVFSASFDIVLAAWRIEVARDERHLDILSAVEQAGYRTASLLGGFVALLLADKIGWQNVFLCGSVVMALTLIGVLLADDSPVVKAEMQSVEPSRPYGEHLSSQEVRVGIGVVMLGWFYGFWLIFDFMRNALVDPVNNKAKDFIKQDGGQVVFWTVVWLVIVSAALIFLNQRNKSAGLKPERTSGIFDILFDAILIPMMELVGRLKWAVILVVALVLSYRFTDLIWGSFAYDFYMGLNFGALGHTKTEVAFASKFMGVLAIILGIALGGLAMLRFGRMPVFVVGAVLAAATNLLFADLASGAVYTDSVLKFLQIDHLFEMGKLDLRMARLTTVIFAENLAVGLASAASVAYLSSIVNKQYAAVQYALLVSLVMLLGVLGRPAIAQVYEEEGFAKAFIICALLGAVAVGLAVLEWIRTSRNVRKTQGS